MRLRPRGGFDAAATLRGGQAFLWTATGDAFEGVALGRTWRVRAEASAHADASADRVDVDVDLPVSVVKRYLGLDPDYPRALARLARDPALAPAVAAHRGLRVLRQDPWEALAAFIVSANNNVPRIEGILRRLATRYGEPVPAPFATSGRRETEGDRGRPGETGGARATRGRRGGDARGRRGDPRSPLVSPASPFPGSPSLSLGLPRVSPKPGTSVATAFPSPAALARADLRDLRAAGLGYRAPFLRDTARQVAEGFPLAALARRPYPVARDALQELPGVGPKVADCVALFGLGHREAFPVDTWIRHAMGRVLGEDLPLGEVADAARARWGRDAGLAQQFLFHAARVAGKDGRRAPGSA